MIGLSRQRSTQKLSVMFLLLYLCIYVFMYLLIYLFVLRRLFYAELNNFSLIRPLSVIRVEKTRLKATASRRLLNVFPT